MRAFLALALVVYLLSGLFVLGAWVPLGERNAHGGLAIIRARATDPSSSTTVDAASSSGSTTASATNRATATTNSTSTSATSTAASTTVASLNTSAASKNETDQTPAGELPLQPLITPALGVSGFILIASGAFLAFIGIRNLRIQVFLSTAFLTSLGVTVLIVYVMNPPVRAAIQGAYLVAVFFTGVTFGALSIVFKELSEGLGCLLGGFCCSMWLLCLKPGGLLTETDAKSGFIGAFSVAFYALSFSQYTRPYGLMASTGVSGGTAVALGIDCYSRAGLKEFWLYIWALNDDIFPLGTDTYPVTRNIRVELAATVIVAILGVVSQLRLWRVIRERRHKDEEMRAEEKRQKEEAEAENSKRLEEDNIKERLEWEAKYGNNRNSPPGPNLPELPGDAKCLADIELEKVDEINSVSSSSEESYRCSDCRERADNGESAYASSVTSDTSGATEGTQTRQHEEMDQSLDGEDSSQKLDDKNAVRIKMFDGTVAAQMRDDESSDMTAIVGSDTDSDRMSGGSSWARSSVKSSVRSDSEEALIPPKDGSPSTDGEMNGRRDTESSSLTIAAVDGVATRKASEINDKCADKETLSSTGTSSSRLNVGENIDDRSVYSREVEDQKLCPMQDIEAAQGKQNDSAPDKSKEDSPTSPSISQSGEKPALKEEGKPLTEPSEQSEPRGALVEKADSMNEAIVSKDTNSTSEYKGPKSPEEQDPRSSSGVESSSKESEISNEKQKSSKPKAKVKTKPKEEPVKLDAKAVKHLPHRASKMIQSYRTDEWAKHLADAEIPEPEPIHSVENERHGEPEETRESAAPVNVEELLQTPLNAQPPAIEHTFGREPSNANEGHRMSSGSQSQSRRGSQAKRKSSRSSRKLSGSLSPSSSNLPQYPPAAAQPQAAQGPANGLPIQASALPPISIAAEQPREEIEPPKPQWRGPPALLDVREGMMRNRLSSFSLGSDPWAARSSPGMSPIETSPRQSTYPIPEEGDNLPLSQRRTMLHQQILPMSQRPTVPTPAPAPVPSNSQATMAAWREYVRGDLYDKRNPLAKMNHAGASTGTADRNPFVQAERNAASVKFGAPVADSKRRGDMSDLHRNAMRRMQAMANRNMNGK